VILNDQVAAYLERLSPARDSLLVEMEAYAAAHNVPIAVPETSALLAMLARGCDARRVLEIGLAIGYTALQLARVLPPGGRVVSLEVDPKMAAIARGFLKRDPAGRRVEVILGEAKETITRLQEAFDLVFIDADKAGYAAYVNLALESLRRHGLIVIDNLLMDGRVASGKGDTHWSQRSVDTAVTLNRRLADDPTVEFVLLPLGDGVGLLQAR
jgi:predicted O-methyltransferase YrrM